METGQGSVLKAGTLGSLGVAALGAVMMAPALGIYANLGLISADSGRAAPAAFMVALLLTLPTAISYALISREIPSAGSGYTWLSESVNPFVGVWTGLLLVATYFFSVILQPLLFGLFLNELMTVLFAWQAGYGTWLIGVIISTLAVVLLAYPGIEISAKSSITLTVLEMAVVLALAGTILIACVGQGRIEYGPFNPAASLHGFQGFSKGLVFALLSFGGFSVITTAAEETHAPRTIIPRAVVTACILLGVFWALTSWGFSLVMPEEDWAKQVASGINPVAVVARNYWGAGSLVVIITALTAALGVYLASIVGYARVAFAMGRDGTLPAFFGALHPKYQVPWNAQHVVLVVTLLVAAVWGRWLGLYRSYEWWGTVVVFFAMVSSILVNFGCTVFFWRFRREEFSWWWHAVIPLVGVITSALPLYYSFGANLWNAGWENGQSIIVFCLSAVLLSGLYTVGLCWLRPEALRTKSSPEGLKVQS
ncbi:MAG: APC family permease [Acidobacteriota bacterium]